MLKRSLKSSFSAIIFLKASLFDVKADNLNLTPVVLA